MERSEMLGWREDGGDVCFIRQNKKRKKTSRGQGI